jgi:hypothetical protein
VRRFINRTAALGVALTLVATAVPCAAGETAAPRRGASLARLSPASRQLLAESASPAVRTQKRDPGAGGPTSPSSFLKSTRGKVTIALMGAGTGLALWSIQHDRKPVKSPIR